MMVSTHLMRAASAARHEPRSACLAAAADMYVTQLYASWYICQRTSSRLPALHLDLDLPYGTRAEAEAALAEYHRRINTTKGA